MMRPKVHNQTCWIISAATQMSQRRTQLPRPVKLLYAEKQDETPHAPNPPSHSTSTYPNPLHARYSPPPPNVSANAERHTTTSHTTSIHDHPICAQTYHGNARYPFHSPPHLLPSVNPAYLTATPLLTSPTRHTISTQQPYSAPPLNKTLAITTMRG
jgi:hypothetical protein